MTAPNDIIGVDVSDDGDKTHLKTLARSHARKMGSLNESITNGDGNYAGILAEYVFVSLFETAERVDQYNFDIKMQNTDGSDMTVDIKTLRRTVDVKPHYSCFVPDAGMNQNCDFYYFCSYNEPEKRLELCGYLPNELFYRKADHLEAGERLPGGFEVEADCHRVKIEDLYQFDVVRDIDN